ncbi:hypothetical protein [Methylobacterium indicum]|uniref:Uncharacterized protein n=1 Tax=Methylobacterium indicum TaxID=1775910 RepID=A0ABR5HHM1_9HYPH|nr:hypothetical protein [Methylobacterium indicum]KMO12799.1 hypothetical protein QR78_26505 [Methylobacterium indicum]KMO25783.1 hypothetical protein QR79_05970 [Methylobacterium indicum]
MSGRVTALMPELQRVTNAAREAKAEELYGLDRLREAMTAKAKAGFDFAQVDAPDGLDLRHTRAAVAALEWLSSRNFHINWEARAGGVGGDGATSYSLRISWKPLALKP